MAQPSVACYFNTRKRNVIGDAKQTGAAKLQHQENTNAGDCAVPIDVSALNAKVVQLKNSLNLNNAAQAKSKKVQRAARPKKIKDVDQQHNIEKFLTSKTTEPATVSNAETNVEAPISNAFDDVVAKTHKTPPTTPLKPNAMDKLKMTGGELNLKQIKQKLTRSNRLAELKASMARYQEQEAKLKKIEQVTAKIPESPGLKAFKSIELEVHLSPQKVQSPEKPYLSPRKESTARRNILNALSPTKNACSLHKTENKLFTMEKLALSLPYKYRTLAEIFRSIDIVCQIMHNRQETITFKKLKPAVEELIKRNLTPKHLAQIKFLFPEAFVFRQEKIRAFGSKVETWELVIDPKLEKESMSSELLLGRRRELFRILIDRVKVFHQEFLTSLEPPLVVDSEKITRWHPEFDIERVPDIEMAELPAPPPEEILTSGKDVLERAKQMFNCNTRMEAALERLKNAKEVEDKAQVVPETSTNETESKLLKGIPKSLLEKVRQRQAAKALQSMTRSDEKDKEVQLYSHLPELARLTRNLFVAEKRSVLSIDIVLGKLSNSIRTFMTKSDIEARLKTIEKEVPGWLMFHNIRNQVYLKISKDSDLSLVQSRLERVLKQKKET